MYAQWAIAHRQRQSKGSQAFCRQGIVNDTACKPGNCCQHGAADLLLALDQAHDDPDEEEGSKYLAKEGLHVMWQA